ncbi:MAG: hypothetical protein PVJ07_08045 [Anaerolineales bacterium]|jgi:hypothetical protein
MKNIGKWLFIVAVVLAIIFSFFTVDATLAGWLTTLVIVLAFAGAYMWVEKDHIKGWLIMALALYTFNTALGEVVFIGDYLSQIFAAMVAPFGVAALALIVKKIVGWFM